MCPLPWVKLVAITLMWPFSLALFTSLEAKRKVRLSILIHVHRLLATSTNSRMIFVISLTLDLILSNLGATDATADAGVVKGKTLVL